MEWSQEKLNELCKKVQKQAMADEEYRKELLEDPNGMIEKEMGEKLPEGFKINIIESDPAYNATFVLPDMMGEELDDGELEQVAGGLSVILVASACGAAISVSFCPADVCAARGTIK